MKKAKNTKGPAGHKWKKLPKGWTDESRKKFWDSLTSRAPKHKVSQCIKRMEGKVDNPGAFCASLADRVIPGWREEAAKERRKKKAALTLKELQQEYSSKRARTMEDFKMQAKARVYQPGGSLQMRIDYDQTTEKPSKDKPRSMIPGKDQLVLEEDHPLSLSKSASKAESAEDSEPTHSKLPGTDNLPTEMDPKVGSQWITRSEMESLCPPCAVRMKKAGFTKVHVSVMRKLLSHSR